VEQKKGEEEGKRHTLGQTDGRRGGWRVTGAGLDARSEQERSEVMLEEDRRGTSRLKPQSNVSFATTRHQGGVTLH
jgi:hypothetical protein